MLVAAIRSRESEAESQELVVCKKVRLGVFGSSPGQIGTRRNPNRNEKTGSRRSLRVRQRSLPVDLHRNFGA